MESRPVVLAFGDFEAEEALRELRGEGDPVERHITIAVWLRCLALAACCAVLAAPDSSGAQTRSVSCLGRLEPGDGVRRVASPSVEGGVIAELMVAEGDRVEANQVLATLTDHGLRQAQVDQLEAELENAVREERRLRKLSRSAATSAANLEAAETAVRVARAALTAARSRLELSVVRAPISGQVLELHSRRGERIGPEGVLELGATDQMMAVAEVYETDIAAVREGQSARVTSPALSAPLQGTVEQIGLKVGRMDVIGTDPIAKTDARVVEVRVRLHEPANAAALTHLQVEIEILP